VVQKFPWPQPSGRYGQRREAAPVGQPRHDLAIGADAMAELLQPGRRHGRSSWRTPRLTRRFRIVSPDTGYRRTRTRSV